MVPQFDRVDALFAKWDRPDSPGCALAILRDDQVIYQRGYGMADLDHDVAIGPDTVFDVGSISKQFTAACIGLLAREGQLSLDDSVRATFPELPGYTQPVTIRHLLHHSSGIRDYIDLLHLAGYALENDYDEEVVLGFLARQKELNFGPGEAYLYSNSGYFLLGEVVRRASGRSLRAYADEEIFGPLGMTATHFHDDWTLIVKNRAVGYAPREGGGYQLDVSLSDVVGDGCLYTTVEDLARWDHNFSGNTLGGQGQDLVDQLTTPGRLSNGALSNYAFGLEVGTYRGLRTIGHGGSWAGYRGEMLRFPDQAFTVICLANAGDMHPWTLVKRIADLMLVEQFGEPPVQVPSGAHKAAALADGEMEWLPGFYLSSEGREIWEISQHGGGLQAETSGETTRLVPTSEGRLFAPDSSFALEVRLGEHREPGLLQVWMEGEKVDSLRRLAPHRLDAGQLSSYAGIFHCPELGVRYPIWLEEGKLYLRRGGAPREQLRLAGKDSGGQILFAGPDFFLQYAEGDGEEISGFCLSTERVRNLVFVRVRGD